MLQPFAALTLGGGGVVRVALRNDLISGDGGSVTDAARVLGAQPECRSLGRAERRLPVGLRTLLRLLLLLFLLFLGLVLPFVADDYAEAERPGRQRLGEINELCSLAGAWSCWTARFRVNRLC